MMKPLKTKVSLTLDEPILKEIQILAEEEDRSLSSYINQVLKAHLRELSQRTQSWRGQKKTAAHMQQSFLCFRYPR